MIQGGDPTATGSGGPGYSVVDTPPRTTKYRLGTVAMAKTQTEAPGTSGSQFFVVTGDASFLTPDYAVLGRVVSGLPVALEDRQVRRRERSRGQADTGRRRQAHRDLELVIAAVVLAAGAATRFGSPKQQLLVEDVLERVRAARSHRGRRGRRRVRAR